MEDAPVLHKSDVPKWFLPVGQYGWLYLVACALYIVLMIVLIPDWWVPGIAEVAVGAALGLLMARVTRRMGRDLMVRQLLRARGDPRRYFRGPPTGHDMLFTLIVVGSMASAAVLSLLLREVFPSGWPWHGPAWIASWWVEASAWVLAFKVDARKWYGSLPE
jgi:hypothetical protein